MAQRTTKVLTEGDALRYFFFFFFLLSLDELSELDDRYNCNNRIIINGHMNHIILICNLTDRDLDCFFDFFAFSYSASDGSEPCVSLKKEVDV